MRTDSHKIGPQTTTAVCECVSNGRRYAWPDDPDTVTIISDLEIVEAFHNSEYIPEPREVRGAFEVEVERVSEFMQKIEHLSKKERYHRISRKILDGLSDGKVGLCSHMRDNAYVARPDM